MNYKRKRRHSKIRCGICAGQRRRWGAGNMKMREIIKNLKNDAIQQGVHA